MGRASSNRRRIVVTGIGVITPAGLTVPAFWKAVTEGTPCAAPLTYFDTSQMPCKLAAQLKGFNALTYVDLKQRERFDPAILYSIAAATEAVSDAGLDFNQISEEEKARTAVVEGTSVTGLGTTLASQTTFLQKGYRGIQPSHYVNAFCGGGSSEVAIKMGITGGAKTVTTACSSGNDALGDAARIIEDDLADVVIAGATEAPIVGPYYSCFINTGVMSRRNDDPARAMVPFDTERSGFVLGEGAAYLILEELTHALTRNARIYCEWRGHGQASDAFHMVASHPEGRGLGAAIQKALLNARMPTTNISYVNVHGSATENNEILETKVYKKAFGSHAKHLMLSATKPVHGHLMGATAAVEAAICALAIHHGVVPPTAGLLHVDPECDLDNVPVTAREYPVRATLNCNIGFGGKASAVILSRFETHTL